MERPRYYDQLAIPYHTTLAVSSGLYHSAKYRSKLEVTPTENNRYFRKSRNLSMCYAGFVQDPFSRSQALDAGKAAFLSCAFDVASDWNKGPSVLNSFEDIVFHEVTPPLADMAIDLLYRDIEGKLKYDGLERGIVATRFILEMMGLQDSFETKTDVDNLGIQLQIVDDVLDYKEDVLVGDQNCLTSDRRDEYLNSFLVDLGKESTERLFPYGGILTYAIAKARQQAESMLANPSQYFI